MYDHINEYKRNDCINTIKQRILNKIYKNNSDPIIIKLKDCLTNKEACDLEMYVIKNIGRLNLCNGSLSNLTDGGDNGGVGKIWNEAQKRKARDITYTPELKQIRKESTKNIWNKRTKEERSKIGDKISQNKKGKPKKGDTPTRGKSWNQYFGEEKTKEIKDKMSITLKKLKTFRINLYLLIDLYFKCTPTKEISQILGVSICTIHRRLTALGLNTKIMHYKKIKQFISYCENTTNEDREIYYKRADDLNNFLES